MKVALVSMRALVAMGQSRRGVDLRAIPDAAEHLDSWRYLISRLNSPDLNMMRSETSRLSRVALGGQRERLQQTMQFCFERGADLVLFAHEPVAKQHISLIEDFSPRMITACRAESLDSGSRVGPMWFASGPGVHTTESSGDLDIDLARHGARLTASLQGGSAAYDLLLPGRRHFQFAVSTESREADGGQLSGEGILICDLRTGSQTDHAILYVDPADNYHSLRDAVAHSGKVVWEWDIDAPEISETELSLGRKLAANSPAFARAWTEIEANILAGSEVDLDLLDHLVLPPTVPSREDFAYVGASRIVEVLRILRRNIRDSPKLRVAVDSLLDVYESTKKLNYGAARHGSTAAGESLQARDAHELADPEYGTVLFFAHLVSYSDEGTKASLQRQLTLLRTIADFVDRDIALRYRLYTVEEAPGFLEARFEVVLETAKMLSWEQSSALREGLGELVHSTFAGSYGISFNRSFGPRSGGADRMQHPAELVEVTRSQGSAGPLEFAGTPDWSHLFDYMRSLDAPTLVELEVRPGSRVTEFVELPAIEPTSVRSELDAADVVRRLALENRGDARRLEMRIFAGGSPELAHPLANLLGAEVAGTANFRTRVVELEESRPDDVNRLFSPGDALRVFHPPFGNVYSSGSSSRSLALPLQVRATAQSGVRLGWARRRHPRGDQRIEVRLDGQDRLRHMYVLGRTGSGKTNLLKQLVSQDIRTPTNGVSVLDPHGDLAHYALNSVPPGRRSDVTLIDLGASDGLPILNPLLWLADRPHLRERILSEILTLFREQFHHEFTGPRFDEMVRLGLDTLLDPKYPLPPSLVELPLLFTDGDFQKNVIDRVASAELKRRWAVHLRLKNDRDYASTIDWMTSKFDQVLNDPTLRACLGGSGTSVDFSRIVADGGILVADLSSATASTEALRLIGNILLIGLRIATYERRHDDDVAPHFIYIDEFQNFTTSSVDTMVAEARKFGVGFVLAHQNLEQLRDFSSYTGRPIEQLLNAILGNVSNLVVFNVGALDARVMSAQLQVDEADIMRIGRYEALARILMDGLETSTFTLLPELALPRATPAARIDVLARMHELDVLKSREELLAEIEARTRAFDGDAAAMGDGGLIDATAAHAMSTRSTLDAPDDRLATLDSDVALPSIAASDDEGYPTEDWISFANRSTSEFASGRDPGDAWGEAIGPFYDWETLAAELEVDVEVLKSWRDSGRLLVVTTSDGVPLIPELQVNHGRKEIWPGIAAATEIFAESGVDPWLAAGWMVAANEQLQMATPVEWIRSGREPELVLSLLELAVAGAVR